MPYKTRVFYRISLFSYKIVNNHFLSDIYSTLVKHQSEGSQHYNTRSFNRSQADRAFTIDNFYIFEESKSKSLFKSHMSVAIPLLINKVLKESIFTNFKDFKTFLLTNLIILFCIFEEKFLLNIH